MTSATPADDGAWALEAHRLAKRYRGRRAWAIEDLSVRVPTGARTALVGPNGAGKTTLIKTWASLERPSAGSVAVLGVDPWQDRAAALARIGYVPQRPALYRTLTTGDHLALVRSLRPAFDRPYAEGRLAELGIGLGIPAAELSGGQQAQLGLALALGTRAPVLLLDEPLASLDPLARREFLGVLIDSARTTGATVLLSSHVITDIELACDRLIVLGEGHLLLDSSIAEARATHWVSAASQRPGAVTAQRIADFPSGTGAFLTLWSVPADAPPSTNLRPATIEELILGRLASGRPTSAARS
jgi:ABC-2 type transport system ATP-binding protein